MILGGWCGRLGVGGLVVMGLFWAIFLGLLLWAVSRLFAPVRGDDVPHQDGGQQLDADEQLDADALDARQPVVRS